MTTCRCVLVHMSGSAQRTPFQHNFENLKLKFSSSFRPLLSVLEQNVPLLQISVPCKRIGEASVRLLDAFVDQMFEFVEEPLLPSQSNFAPVQEVCEPVQGFTIEGEIPEDFPEGVYIRNGSNPLHGGFTSAVSVFGKTSNVWVEGEGMLHAMYFKKDSFGNWTTAYKNRYVETATYLLEKDKKRPRFLPAVEGNPAAVLSSFLLNMLRFGFPDKLYSNTSVIEHAGKFYAVAENSLPQEIDIWTLETLGEWTVNGAWLRPFTSHPKKSLGTGELVMMGISGKQPFYELGVISADGKKMIHKVDLKFERSVISHEVGITERYNVILDFPIIVDVNRVLQGGALIKYEKEKYSRIGIMPRYGNADSVQWFTVKPSCAFHLINCFENGNDEVVVLACKAREAIIPGPDLGTNKFEWFSRGLKNMNSVDENGESTDQDGMLFSRVYEWRLNMKTGEVKEGYLTGTEFAMDFPMINPNFTGVRNKYAYVQVVNSKASEVAGMAKYGGLAKLYLEERNDEVSRGEKKDEDLMKVEYHMFPPNTFCSGATFVAKPGAVEEDDGWIIAFVHDEDTNTSQLYIVGTTKNISRSDASVAKVAIPRRRVPYGFHGIFVQS